jgi:succinyl-CoA synthetase beta subunit
MLAAHSDIPRILEAARADGWVLEDAAKGLLELAGLEVPRFGVARTREEALSRARAIGYPVAAKILSPRIVHKSDAGGVALGITGDGAMEEAFERLSRLEGFRGVLVEEMLPRGGIELILGAKNDTQFGPMILLGMGGTAVEIYRDIVLKMAPLTAGDVQAMIAGLKARRLLEGYRGAAPVDREKLTETILAFSDLVMALSEGIDSIDINPLLCFPDRCVAADARIILHGQPEVPAAAQG